MIIDDVKQNLRISHNALDLEISDLVDAAKAQLVISGVTKSVLVSPDPLMKRAIILYCKANFGLDNKDSEKYQARFDSLVSHITLCPEYIASEVI